MVPCHLLGMSEPKQCCGRRRLPYNVVGAINSHTRQKQVKPPHMHLGIHSVVGVDIYHTWWNTVKPPTCV